MKKTLHIIPHSHWDREWYMPFEKHRVHLVELFDDLIATMEQNPDYTYYHMDGQYIAIEDYLEIRPYMKDRLQKLVRDGRIKIGPWYVLQDEYLTSGEANVRNMLYGIRLCREFGAEPVSCGYFPDAFGNVSQAPQIVRGFGFDNAVFGRGVNDIISIDDANGGVQIKREGITTSELIWRAPDGSEIIGVLMANWYCNAMELPTDPEKLRQKIERISASAEKVALTDHLLGMNGCDHQPVQTDLHDVIRLANEVQNEIEVKQSNFDDYIASIRPSKDIFPVYEGEINGQLSSGSCPLICTASAHIDIKQDNHDVQHLLERIAEPLSASAMIFGGEYKQDLFLYAWKKLMQNHPHDSICACSCDEVYDEMKVRFQKALACGEQLRDDSLRYLAEQIDTQIDGEKAIIVFSTEPNSTIATVKVNVDFDLEDDVREVAVFDENGNEIPSKFKLIHNQFTYTLPRHTFRKPKYVNRFEVEMQIQTQGMGYKVYTVKKQAPFSECGIKYTEHSMENEFLSLDFNPNGTLNITDKRSGITYRDQNLFEDTQDRGNLYNYVQPDGDVAITNASTKASFSIDSVTPWSVTFKCAIPLNIDADLTSYVTLSSRIARVDFKTVVTNRTDDHRLRALFSTDIPTESVYSEGQFDVVRRDIKPSILWKNPCNAQRTQAFVSLEADDGERSLIIANKGLCEYEVLRDGRNTLAITLLRAIGDIGDWGVFPSPKGQMKGTYTLEYSFIPYAKQERSVAYSLGYSFAYPSLSAISTDAHAGKIPSKLDLVSFDNDYVRMSAFKKCEERNSIILRVFNTSTLATALTLKLAPVFKSAHLTDLGENIISDLDLKNNSLMLELGTKKIATIELCF